MTLKKIPLKLITIPAIQFLTLEEKGYYLMALTVLSTTPDASILISSLQEFWPKSREKLLEISDFFQEENDKIVCLPLREQMEVAQKISRLRQEAGIASGRKRQKLLKTKGK